MGLTLYLKNSIYKFIIISINTRKIIYLHISTIILQLCLLSDEITLQNTVYHLLQNIM